MPSIVNLLLCCLSVISTVELVLLHFHHFYVNVKAPQVQVPARQTNKNKNMEQRQCLPTAYADTSIAIPRGKKCTVLGEHRLIGQLHHISSMTQFSLLEKQ